MARSDIFRVPVISWAGDPPEAVLEPIRVGGVELLRISTPDDRERFTVEQRDLEMVDGQLPRIRWIAARPRPDRLEAVFALHAPGRARTEYVLALIALLGTLATTFFGYLASSRGRDLEHLRSVANKRFSCADGEDQAKCLEDEGHKRETLMWNLLLTRKKLEQLDNVLDDECPGNSPSDCLSSIIQGRNDYYNYVAMKECRNAPAQARCVSDAIARAGSTATNSVTP